MFSDHFEVFHPLIQLQPVISSACLTFLSPTTSSNPTVTREREDAVRKTKQDSQEDSTPLRSLVLGSHKRHSCHFVLQTHQPNNQTGEPNTEVSPRRTHDKTFNALWCHSAEARDIPAAESIPRKTTPSPSKSLCGPPLRALIPRPPGAAD